MTGRRALVWGVVAATAWIAFAALSASLSPLARRPLLDGFVPGVQYRWVDPPAALAPTNVPPSAAEFVLRFRRGLSETGVVFTPDNQATLVATQGVVADDQAHELRLSVTPESPSTAPALPGDLEPFGNVVRLEAAATPGGAVATFDSPLTVILVYPATSDLHATEHELLWSPDGRAWTQLETTDSIGQQQAQAEVTGPGLLVVGGVPSALPTASDDSGSRNAFSTILLVVAGASLLIGIGLLVRARNVDR